MLEEEEEEEEEEPTWIGVLYQAVDSVWIVQHEPQDGSWELFT